MRKTLWILMIIILFISVTDTITAHKTKHEPSQLMTSDNPTYEKSDNFSVTISDEPIFGEHQTDRFVAHRGFSDHAPENSNPAFELAGKSGFWGIETDIIETMDGIFMCMHDDELDRTTTGTGFAWDYTYSELMDFDIDYGNDIEQYPHLKIPTLVEFLNICAIYDCIPLIEIKHITGYDALLSVIEESGLKDRCIISGGIEDLEKIRELNSSIPLMVVGYSNKPYTFYTELIQRVPVNSGILYDRNSVTQEVVNEVHSKNMLIGVWTLDTAEEAIKYRDFGVDFVVTNHIPGLNHMINKNE